MYMQGEWGYALLFPWNCQEIIVSNLEEEKREKKKIFVLGCLPKFLKTRSIYIYNTSSQLNEIYLHMGFDTVRNNNGN